MNSFVWYLPTPARWIRCEIVSELFGRVTVHPTSDEAVGEFGDRIDNLKKRPVSGAWICEK